MPFPVVAAATAAAALGSTALNVGATSSMNQKTRAWNEFMYQRQYDDNIRLWEMQNAYNSPEQQMARLKAAGLNPNLVYGNGATASSPAAPKSASPGSWNPQTPDFGGLGQGIQNAIQTYQDVTMQDAQLKNMEAQRRNMDLDAALKTVGVTTAGLKNAKTALEYDTSKKLQDTAIATADAKLRQIETATDIKVSKEVRDAAMHAPSLAGALQKVANLSKQGDKIVQEISNLEKRGVLDQLEINMRKLGLTFHDSAILRVLAQFAGGRSLPEVIKSLGDEVNKMADSTPVGRAVQAVRDQKLYRADFDSKKFNDDWNKFKNRR